MKRKLGYVSGEPWWRTAGIPPFDGQSWSAHLQFIRDQTAKVMRAHGLDPDFSGARGDQQELLIPYQRPIIRECHEAYRLAGRCLDAAEASLHGYRLSLLWEGQALAAVSAPDVLAQSRLRSIRSQGRQLANKARQSDADVEALEHFASWQQKTKRVLVDGDQPMTAAERVRMYIATGQVKSDREKRRIRALLKAGRIPELKR